MGVDYKRSLSLQDYLYAETTLVTWVLVKGNKLIVNKQKSDKSKRKKKGQQIKNKQ